MSKCLAKQRQLRNNLILSLFGSILIHGLVAFVLSRHKSLESPQTEKPIEIIIVEQPTEQSPANNSNSQPKPVPSSQKQSPLVKTTPAPSPKAKPPSVNNQPTYSPETIASPPKRKQLRANIEPTPPVNNKSDKPLPIPTETPVKYPQITPQPKISSDVEQPDDNNQIEELKNAELLTKPGVNSDNQEATPEDNLQGNYRNQKPIIPALDRPVNPPQFPPDTNSASTGNNNSDREMPAFADRQESNQSEPLPIATNSRTTTDAENSSTEKQGEGEGEGEDLNPTTEENDSTAANTVSDEPQPPLSISCTKNCQPKYPSALGGAEGSAGILLTINADGLVVNADIASSNGNPKLDQEALKAARKMKFSSIDRDRATVRINISFTVAGSDFERQAREEQEVKEKQEKERIEQLEQERQAELELEQQRIEQERKAEIEQERQQPKLSPTDDLERERLRKFRERIENYQ